MRWIILFMVCSAILTGCGGRSQPTPTPTKTPMPPTATATPYQAPVSSTETPTPAHSTDAPLVAGEVAAPAPVVAVENPGQALGEAIGAAVLDAELDDAMERAIEIGAANMTADQLSFAVLAVLRRAPAWMDQIAGGVAVDDAMEVYLDACHQVAFTASLRVDNLRVRNALGDLAAGCTAVRMDAVSGTVKPDSITSVRDAIGRVDALLKSP